MRRFKANVQYFQPSQPLFERSLMPKKILSVALFLLALSACKKEVTEKSRYLISESGDFVINRNPFDKDFGAVLPQLFFSIQYEGAESKRITLRVEDLPAGTSDSLSAPGGYPDFNTTLFLKDSGVVAGSYSPTLKLKVAGTTEVTTHTFPLTLTGFGTCAACFANREFTATSDCAGLNGGQDAYTVTSTLQTPFGDTVLLNNYRNRGTALKVVFDCKKRQFEVPGQDIGSTSVVGYGNGQLSDDVAGVPATLTFTILETTASGPTFCNLVLKFR